MNREDIIRLAEQAELFERTQADIRAEINHVIGLPDGGYLSKEAQAVYEQDGARRFAEVHPSLAARFAIRARKDNI